MYKNSHSFKKQKTSNCNCGKNLEESAKLNENILLH